MVLTKNNPRHMAVKIRSSNFVLTLRCFIGCRVCPNSRCPCTQFGVYSSNFNSIFFKPFLCPPAFSFIQPCSLSNPLNQVVLARIFYQRTAKVGHLACGDSSSHHPFLPLVSLSEAKIHMLCVTIAFSRL